MHNSALADSVVAELSRLESRLFLLSPSDPPYRVLPRPGCSLFPIWHAPALSPPLSKLTPETGVEGGKAAFAENVRYVGAGGEPRINYEQKRTLGEGGGVEESQPLLQQPFRSPSGPVRDDRAPRSYRALGSASTRTSSGNTYTSTTTTTSRSRYGRARRGAETARMAAAASGIPSLSTCAKWRGRMVRMQIRLKSRPLTTGARFFLGPYLGSYFADDTRGGSYSTPSLRTGESTSERNAFSSSGREGGEECL